MSRAGEVGKIGPEDALVGAIDQGTSSSRVLIFRASDWKLIVVKQVQMQSVYPRQGWCEQDPMLLLSSVTEALEGAAKELEAAGGTTKQVAGFGVTNQRETTVVWDRETGLPLHNAIVWLDSRTKDIVDGFVKASGDKNVHQRRCGLPISTYFSACKLKWLFDNVPEVREASDRGTLMVGTVDTWLIWNLTKRQRYVTDVTNASRTMLMNITSLAWDPDLCQYFGIDASILPEIVSSSEPERFGSLCYDGSPFMGTRIAGCLGDQQAALVGQRCFKNGMAKCTYGTGCFMLHNVGEQIVYSDQGLLSTVAYQFGEGASPVYALEGSIAIAGAAISWLKSIGVIESASDLETLARQVEDTGGFYFVPAFTGLFAPYWRPDARGTIVGITQYTSRGHICRGTLEAVAFQVAEILECMKGDSGLEVTQLAVDGGVVNNQLLLEIQSEFLGIRVVRPKMVETTALGAAFAAAIALNLATVDSIGAMTDKDCTVFKKERDETDWANRLKNWKIAVQKSFGAAELSS